MQISFLLLSIAIIIPNIMINDKPKDYIEEELGFINGIYAIETTVGSINQNILFLVDTIHSTSSIISPSCAVCVTHGFDNKSSTTFELESKENSTIVMNNEDFIGFYAHDNIKFSKFEIQKYQFLFVNIITHTHSNSFKYEGYIGFGFSKKRDTYLSYLKKASIINKKIFGIHLKTTTDNGDLHVGGIDEVLINSTSNVTYAEVTYTDESDKYTEWYIKSNKVDINKTSNNHTIEGPFKLLLNSASTIIKIPKTFFFTNMHNLFPKEAQCQINQNNLFHCLCENNYHKVFPSFYFHLKDAVTNEDKDIKVQPSDYISIHNRIISTPDSNCFLHISLNYKNDYWIFGTSVMNNFYLIFDQEEDRIGFYRFNQNHYKSSELLISLLTISGSLILIVTIYLLYKYCYSFNCMRINEGNANRNDESFAIAENNG